MASLNDTTNGVLASRPDGRLHQIRDVRIRIGVEVEKVAAELGKSLATIALEEDPATDLRLSVLRQWSHALGVPASGLLVECPEYAGIPGLTVRRLKQIESAAAKLVSMTSDKATLTFAKGLCYQIQEFFEDDPAPLADPGSALP